MDFWFENKPSGNPGVQGNQIRRLFAYWADLIIVAA
jgi:hypothetical protein